VGVPEPFDGAGTLDKRCGDFAFEKSGLVFGSAAGDLIEVQLALQSGFLDEHGFTGLLGSKRIPKNVVVLPPGVIGGEVDGLAPESGREAVLNATFILANGDKLLRSGGADSVAHSAGPMGERF